MRPEPGNRPARKRRWPNEARPLTIRVGAIRDELDARSDGTEAGYRAVIMRDLKRYYELLNGYQRRLSSLQLYDMADWIDMLHEGFSADKIVDAITSSDDYTISYVQALAIVDALERVKILTEHAGLTVDAALVAVGLVSEEEG